MTYLCKMLADGAWFLSLTAPAMARTQGVAKGLFLLPIVLWWVWIYQNRKKRDLTGAFGGQFLLELKILLLVGAFELLFLGPGVWQQQCGPFVAGYVLLGLMALRGGRIDQSGQKQGRFWRQSALTALILVALAMLVTFPPVYHALGAVVSGIYQTVIAPLVLAVVALVLKGLQAIAALFPNVSPEFHGSLSQVEENTQASLGFSDMSGEASGSMQFLGWAIGAIVLLLIFFWLYRHFTAMGRLRQHRPGGTITYSRADKRPPQTKEKESFWEKKTIRYYYRKFLWLCRKKGLTVSDRMTTDQFYLQAKAHWSENLLAEFHWRYRQVRYGAHQETQEERKRAKELWKELQAQEEKARPKEK